MEYFLGQTNNYRGQHFYMYYRVWIPFLPILYLHSAQFPLSLAIYILLILFRLTSGLPKTVWRWGTKRPPPSISVLWYKLSYHYHIIIISLSYHFHIIMNPEPSNSIDIEFAWFVHRKLSSGTCTFIPLSDRWIFNMLAREQRRLPASSPIIIHKYASSESSA